MDNRIKILLLAFIAVQVIAAAQAQDVAVKADTFVSPKPVKRVNPQYPLSILERHQEGWVEINMMIDENGKPFEVMVTNSSGIKDLERSTITAVEHWVFEPAQSNGKPVVGSLRTLMTFQYDDQRAASKAFGRAYRDFNRDLREKSQQEAEARLKKLRELGAKNRYELAFLGLANFLYAQKYGNEIDQMKYLIQALSSSRRKDDPQFLFAAEALFARRELMKLQVKNRYYREALDTWKYLNDIDDKEGIKTFKPVVDQLLQLEQGGQRYEIPVVLDDRGEFNMKLFKHKVYAAAIEGKVHQFKLWCDKKFVEFAVESEVSYNIPEEWGVCVLTVFGSEGTKLQLGQE